MSSLNSLPRIKVCGITQVNDLECLKSCRVQAVGVNLVPSSKRFVKMDSAISLATRAAELGLKTVAVVMDATEAELNSIAGAFHWDFIQLHGTECPSVSSACHGIAIIKAVSWSGRAEEEQLVASWSQHFGGSVQSNQNLGPSDRSKLAGFLLDAYAPGQGGGTGKQARWDLIYPRPRSLESWPIMLAGGLNPENVGLAIRATHCDGVDTASGVESGPRVKSPELVRLFAERAESAFV